MRWLLALAATHAALAACTAFDGESTPPDGVTLATDAATTADGTLVDGGPLPEPDDGAVPGFPEPRCTMGAELFEGFELKVPGAAQGWTVPMGEGVMMTVTSGPVHVGIGALKVEVFDRATPLQYALRRPYPSSCLDLSFAISFPNGVSQLPTASSFQFFRLTRGVDSLVIGVGGGTRNGLSVAEQTQLPDGAADGYHALHVDLNLPPGGEFLKVRVRVDAPTQGTAPSVRIWADGKPVTITEPMKFAFSDLANSTLSLGVPYAPPNSPGVLVLDSFRLR